MKNFYNNLTRKGILSLLIILFSMAGFSATYYVSSSGNDSNSGQSSSLAWKSLSKVNSVTFGAGDQVLFQKGDTFYGSLTIRNSGTSGSPILIGSYGTGANPVITGFTTVSGWTSLGGNIWESTSAVSTLPTCNMVAVNGVNTAMGRFPNADASNGGYLTITGVSGRSSVSSSGLSGSPNWTGAEAVVRTSRWTVDKSVIASQSGGTLNYSLPGYTPTVGYGLFIQNDSRTLDQQNEWYYHPSTKKIRMYSTSTPQNVKVASVNNLLTISGDYVTVNGIDFSGANASGLYNESASVDHITVLNSNVSFSGFAAVLFRCSYFTLENNTFTDSNNKGVDLTSCSNVVFRNNLIQNSGMFPGMVDSGNGTCYGIGCYGTSNVLIEYNRVLNTGYKAIDFYGQSVTVKNNFVDKFCLTLDDGGGIYTYTGGQAVMNNIVVSNNIVLNGIGAPQGTGDDTGQAYGIYLDDVSYNAEVSNNTVSGCANYGIYLHNVRYTNTHHNTVFNNEGGAVYFHDNYGDGTVSDNDIHNNILISSQGAAWTVQYRSSASQINPGGLWDYNYYIQVPNASNPIRVGCSGTAYNNYTLEWWKSFSGQDANSLKSPQPVASINDLRFEYNATQSAKSVSLSQPMMDAKGNKYSGTITLQPFTSLVLMKDPNAAPIVIPNLYNVTGGGSYTSGGSGVPVGLSGSQTGVNYQLKLGGVNTGNPIAGSGSAINFGNKTVAGVYTVAATHVSSGSTVLMNGNATVSINPLSTAVTGVSVSPVSASVSVGGTQQLTATVSPTNATNKAVSWSSSNNSVATINSQGLVSGVAVGSATITVRTHDGSKTATSVITVSSLNVVVTGVSISPVSASVSVGSTRQLTATVSPTNATNKAVSWSSSNNSVATVNSQGLVSGIAAGSAIITVKTQDGSKTATSTITVNSSNVLVTGVGVSPVSASVFVGGTQQLTAAVSPTNATNKIVSWSSSNNSVATVNSAGLVSGVAAGSATITVKTQDGSKTATSTITVSNSSSGSAYLGYNLKGSSVVNCGAGEMIATQFTATSSFTANKMFASMPVFNGKIKGAIYSDYYGKLGIKLGETSEKTSFTTGGFQELSGLNVSIKSGTKYWLVIWGSSTYSIDGIISGGNSIWKISQKYGRWPYVFPKPSGSDATKYSIYVTGGLKSASIFESDMIGSDEDITEIVKTDIFPNPSKGKITVRFSIVPEAGSRIDILDTSGRKVVSRLITDMSEEFDLENEPAGLYFVKTVLGSDEITQKIIINK